MLLPGDNLYTLIQSTFGTMGDSATTPAFWKDRAIMTSKNNAVATINEVVLNMFPGEEVHEFISSDTMDEPDEQIRYPSELLNSIESSGLPPHKLRLKVGCPLMLLRNLNTSQGLCNGTRLICRSFTRFVLEAEVISGSHIGSIVLIPRISLTAAKTQCPIEFKRTQFPVRLAFAMTINKAQGQTFNTVGLYLPEPVFTHGLLYVAMSRVRLPTSLKITVDRDSSIIPGREGRYTRNVVYTDVLL